MGFRPKYLFLDFCNTPELMTSLSQPCYHKKENSPTTSPSCAQDSLSVSFPPASGQQRAGLGPSTWLQGLLSCSDSMAGSQNTSERESEGVTDGLKMLDICMSAPQHLGKSQCKKNSSATVLLLHQTHFLRCKI